MLPNPITSNARVPQFDQLESRTFLSATQIGFDDFSSTTNLVANGFGGASVTNGGRLRLTDGAPHEARSVWNATPVPIDRFRSDFTFISNASPTSADGITFTIQNGNTAALGADGLDLGYTGIGGASQAAALNMYNLGNFGSRFGFASNGQRPPTNTSMTPLDLHNGHLFHATVKYDGTTLLTSIRDGTNRSQVFTASKAVDLPAAMGADTAIVGFTGSTGNFFSTQEIVSWRYSGSNLPTIAAAADASPAPVVAKSTTLSVLGADSAGESHLSYTWSLLRRPAGARTPTFSSNNGTSDAKSIAAQFYKGGTYRFRATVTNESGGRAISDVSVLVLQTPTGMRMTNHKRIVERGQTVNYDASVIDQFNHALRQQPRITFALQSGAGSINQATGLFTASSTTSGHVVASASADALTGTVGATVMG